MKDLSQNSKWEILASIVLRDTARNCKVCMCVWGVQFCIYLPWDDRLYTRQV